jgi:hypothetical protein
LKVSHFVFCVVSQHVYFSFSSGGGGGSLSLCHTRCVVCFWWCSFLRFLLFIVLNMYVIDWTGSWCPIVCARLDGMNYLVLGYQFAWVSNVLKIVNFCLCDVL